MHSSRRKLVKAHSMAQSMTVLSTPELAFYLVAVAYFLGVLIHRGVAFCSRLALSQHIQVPGLQPGWLMGRQQDLSDVQWREFRAAMPLLAGIMSGFVVLSRMVRALAPGYHLAFYLVFSLAFLAVLHGACLAFVLGLLLTSYALSKALAGKPFGLLLLWAWHCATFLLVRFYDGFRFGTISPFLAPLDAHRGLLRWHIHYNLLLLRMLSFAADLHWQRTGQAPRVALPPGTPPSPTLDLRARTELPLPPGSYNLASFLAYALYPPTYIAGPTATFNAFASQLAAPSCRISPGAVALYGLRAAAGLLTLELLTHTLWFNAVAKHKLWAALARAEGGPGAQAGLLAPLDMTLVPWWVMMFVWLKFLVIWRFFRLFCLADGMEVPENMTRCIANNHSITGFWKAWHASYNQWLVRYMYIPLGGGAWRLINVWPIFTFVALWHDLEARLLGWAWLSALLFAPEAAAAWVGAQAWCFADKAGRGFRRAAALAGACNVVLLIAANMVGFVLGPQGVLPFLAQTVAQPTFLPALMFAIFSGVQLQLALRDVEARAAGRRAQRAGLDGKP